MRTVPPSPRRRIWICTPCGRTLTPSRSATGDTDTTVLVPQNSAIGSRIPADPTKKGYTFEGWFNGEEKLTAETVISGDVIYTAQWSPITYTIAFSGGEGGQGAMDSISATYDQEVTLPKNTFTRPGYYFNGWSASSGASSGSYADEKPVKNLTTKQGRRSPSTPLGTACR